jgi:hypothetical protein
MTFQVVFDPRTIHRSKRGNVTSTFYLVIGEQPFPEEGWNDFSETLFIELESVVDRLVDAAVGSNYEFHFMDGPFLVVFRRTYTGVGIVAAHQAGAMNPAHASCDLVHLQEVVSKSARGFRKALSDFDTRQHRGE